MFRPYLKRASYYETDQMGVVHHSNFIRWFEDSRIDYLDQAGFTYKRMEELDAMLPVMEVTCKYKKSVRFSDDVYITTKIVGFNGFRMDLEYQVIDAHTLEICATGTSLHCFFSHEMKPLRTKKSHPEIYEVFSSRCGLDMYEIKPL